MSAELREQIQAAIAQKQLSGRLWLYSNYHCNLACRYCLTESSPIVPKRILPRDKMLSLAKQAASLGFTSIGITGGEPFLLPWMVDSIAEIASVLPVVVLTNGTLFHPRRLVEVEKLVGLNVQLQISLDRPNPILNDEMRGPENFAKVSAAVPELIKKGIAVRIATTMDEQSAAEKQELRHLLDSWGVMEKDHIFRLVIDRGRAAQEGLGVTAPIEQLPPELTISVAGAFWSPFAPTYKKGRLQTDFLICRKTNPLAYSAKMLLHSMKSIPKEDCGDTSGFV